MSRPGERLTFRLDSDAKPQRLDAVVVVLLHDVGREVSRSTVRQWIDDGRVLVNGAVAKASARPPAGATIELEPAPPPPSSAEPDSTVPIVSHSSCRVTPGIMASSGSPV